MLWRRGAPSQIRTEVPLPSLLRDGIYIGAFSLSAIRELGLWQRLLQGDGLNLTALLLVGSSFEGKIKSAHAVLPPSSHAVIRWEPDEEGEWSQFAPSVATEGAFCFVARGGVAEVLVIGPPTETAWEQFVPVALSL